MYILDDNNRIHDAKVFNEIFKLELKRSFRYKRPLTLAILEVKADTQLIDSIIKFNTIISKLLINEIREVDIIGKIRKDYYILLPETTAQGGNIAILRVLNKLKIYITDKDLYDIQKNIIINYCINEVNLKVDKIQEIQKQLMKNCLDNQKEFKFI